jgi:hypothetical protein
MPVRIAEEVAGDRSGGLIIVFPKPGGATPGFFVSAGGAFRPESSGKANSATGEAAAIS